MVMLAVLPLLHQIFLSYEGSHHVGRVRNQAPSAHLQYSKADGPDDEQADDAAHRRPAEDPRHHGYRLDVILPA